MGSQNEQNESREWRRCFHDLLRFWFICWYFLATAPKQKRFLQPRSGTCPKSTSKSHGANFSTSVKSVCKLPKWALGIIHSKHSNISGKVWWVFLHFPCSERCEITSTRPIKLRLWREELWKTFLHVLFSWTYLHTLNTISSETFMKRCNTSAELSDH